MTIHLSFVPGTSVVLATLRPLRGGGFRAEAPNSTGENPAADGLTELEAWDGLKALIGHSLAPADEWSAELANAAERALVRP